MKTEFTFNCFTCGKSQTVKGGEAYHTKRGFVTCPCGTIISVGIKGVFDMSEKKSYPRMTDNCYATRNKMFRGKIRDRVVVDIMEERSGVFRVYLWVDDERTPESPEFTDIVKATEAQKKFVKKITLETDWKPSKEDGKCEKNFLAVLESHPRYTPDFLDYDVKLWGRVMPQNWFEVQASIPLMPWNNEWKIYKKQAPHSGPSIKGYIKFYKKDVSGSFFVDGSTKEGAYYTIYGNVEIIFSKDFKIKTKEVNDAKQ